MYSGTGHLLAWHSLLLHCIFCVSNLFSVCCRWFQIHHIIHLSFSISFLIFAAVSWFTCYWCPPSHSHLSSMIHEAQYLDHINHLCSFRVMMNWKKQRRPFSMQFFSPIFLKVCHSFYFSFMHVYTCLTQKSGRPLTGIL